MISKELGDEGNRDDTMYDSDCWQRNTAANVSVYPHD
jgi:hypothetical protein